MLKNLTALASIVILAAACGGGGPATPSPSPAPTGQGLPFGLIAFADAGGIGLLDPDSGKTVRVAPFPAGGAFSASGPVWGPAPGVPYPVVYFTVHDNRPAESRNSAGVVPYDWLFRLDPFTGLIQPLSANQDSQSEGPIGLVGNDHYVALTVGCCATYEVDALDLAQQPSPLKILARPTDPVAFFTEGMAPGISGLIAVRQAGSGAWFWLNADAGVLNPFPLKLGTDDGPVAISPDGTMAAVSLPDRGALIEPIDVTLPIASPTPTSGSSPGPVASTSPPPSATKPAAPRSLNSRLPHPDGLAWSPDARRIAVAVNGELEIYNAAAPDGTAPLGRFLTGGTVTGVAWSAPIPGRTLAAVKRSPGPQATVDALLAATMLPAAADTPENRPLTKVYLWQFDSSRVSPIAAITDATPAVLAKYPPLAAGVVIHHWAASDSWALIGGCTRYRVVITGSIAPVASTVGLAGDTLCSAPRPTATASPT